MLQFICFEIKNFEEYLGRNNEGKMKYSIELKSKLSEKLELAFFPAHKDGLVVVKLWPEQGI